MEIVYHIGAHETDEDRLLKCLLKNRDTLAEPSVTLGADDLAPAWAQGRPATAQPSMTGRGHKAAMGRLTAMPLHKQRPQVRDPRVANMGRRPVKKMPYVSAPGSPPPRLSTPTTLPRPGSPPTSWAFRRW